MTDFHGDDDGAIVGDVVREPSGPLTPGPPRTLLTLDVDDHIDPATRDWATLDENGRIVRTAEHDAVPPCSACASRRGSASSASTPSRRAGPGLIGSRIRADAMTIESFWDYDLDSHPFAGLGGYDQAVRVFGGVATRWNSCSEASTSRSSTTMDLIPRRGPTIARPLRSPCNPCR